MPEGVRIQKALADAGLASRRAADALVVAGRVTVNGSPAVTGQRVDPLSDRISVDGRPLRTRPAHVYLMVCKPAGVTSTVSDRHAERTVVELVSPDLRRRAGRLYPVGRLDRDSEGLLLLTNDGDWAQRVLHPRHAIEREYAIGLEEPLRQEQARDLQAGVQLDEGFARLGRLRPASDAEAGRLEQLVGRSPRRLTWYRAVLTQGWRRQLRRMFAAVEAPVARLVRVRIGSLRLESLHPGEARELTAGERDRLVAGSARRSHDPSEGAPPDGAPPGAPAARGAAGPGSGERPQRPLGRGIVVSLDGPGSSGKSSVGAAAALRLGYRFCDTGVLYRALAWLALRDGLAPRAGASEADGGAPIETTELLEMVPRIALTADEQGRLRRVTVDGRDVTDRLHDAAVDAAVSGVARVPELRASLLPLQRHLGDDGAIIVAGRDIGSVVLPDAELKLYLEVSLDERARRRAAERGIAPSGAEASVIRDALGRRDDMDSSRVTAPLTVPAGATVIVADGLTFEETVAEVVRLVRAAERSQAVAQERGLMPAAERSDAQEGA